MASYSDLRIGDRVRITRSAWNSSTPVGTEGEITDRDRYLTVSGSVYIRTDIGNYHWRSVDNVEKIEPVATGTFAVGARATLLAGHGTCDGSVGSLVALVSNTGTGSWLVSHLNADGSARPTACTYDSVREDFMTIVPASANAATLTHSEVRAFVEEGRTRYNWCDARFDVLDNLSIPREAPAEPTVSVDDLLRVAREVGRDRGVLSQVNDLIAAKNLAPSAPRPGVFEDGDTVKWASPLNSPEQRFVVRTVNGQRSIIDKATFSVTRLAVPTAFVKADD